MDGRAVAIVLAVGILSAAATGASSPIQADVAVIVDVPRGAAVPSLTALGDAVRRLPAERISHWFLLTEEGVAPDAAARLATEPIVQVVRTGSVQGPGFADAVNALASRGLAQVTPIDGLGLQDAPRAIESAPASAIPAAVQAYVGRFEQTMRFVIAEEHYEQTVRSRAGSYNLPITSPGVIVERRKTDAEVALLHLAEDVWMMSRRVERVNGRVVPSPTRAAARPVTEADAIAELERTADDAARWNIGPARNINTPTLALWFLTPRFAGRFRVASAGSERLNGRVVSVLRFKEITEPPLMQVDGDPVPAAGRIWVDPQSGMVARTELILERRAAMNSAVVIARGVTTVTYGPAQGFDCWVPVEMRESYDFPRNRSADLLSTVATYSHYRRFSVHTRIK